MLKRNCLAFLVVSFLVAFARADDLVGLLARCRQASPHLETRVELQRKDGNWAAAEVAGLNWSMSEFVRWADIPTIESIELQSGRPMSGEGIRKLAALPQLRRMTPYGTFTEEGVRAIFSLRPLEELDLTHTEISNAMSDDYLRQLQDLVNLRHLSIHVYRRELRYLRQLKKLPHLDLGLFNDDKDWDLSDLKGLTSLRIHGLSSATLASLETLPALETLDVFAFVPDPAKRDLSVLRKLQALQISATRFDPAHPIRLPAQLQRIQLRPELASEIDFASAKCIRHVQLDFEVDYLAVDGTPQPIDLKWLSSLNELSELTLLNPLVENVKAVPRIWPLRTVKLIGGSPCKIVSDEVLQAVTNWSQLEALTVKDAFTVKDLKCLESLHNLQRLELEGQFTQLKLTAEMLDGIWRLKRLRVLALPACDVEADCLDRALPHIGARVDLEELSLTGPLSDAALCSLESLKKLRVLDLRLCSGYTDEGLARLVRSLPNLRVLKLASRRE